VLPGTQIDGAAYLAERCRQAVSSHPLEDVDEVTISCGVVQYESGESAESLLKRADECLYRAKDAGRNRVVHA
ncbi:MAG: GGDEF domain-containing protein, partial [Sedimenticola sp.]